MELQYNSPVILTFFLLSLLVLFLDDWTGGWTTMHLFCVYRSSLKDPLFYIRLFGHVLFYPQLGVKTLLDGGRRRTKNLYGVFKRTVPAGQVRQ